MASPAFEREYNLKYLGTIGNVFLPQKIDEAIQLGRDMDVYNKILAKPELMDFAQTTCYIGCDPGYSTSAFGIVLVAIIDDKICVLESLELHKPLFDDAINAVGELMLKYGLDTNNTKILVDASAPSVVSALKSQMGEATDYLSLLNYRKKYKIRDA